MKTKLKKKQTISKLKKKLDQTFSIWIRKRDADSLGFVRCFTCGKRLHWKEAQNSHYVSRSHMSLRFDERNCQVACLRCNIFLKGNLDSYALKLLAKYGDDILHDLNLAKAQIKRYTMNDLEDLIQKYQT